MNVSETNYHWLRMPGDFTGGIPGSGTSSEGLPGCGEGRLPHLARLRHRRGRPLLVDDGQGRQQLPGRNVTNGGLQQAANWSNERLQAFLETGYHF